MTPEEFYALQPPEYIQWEANPGYAGYVGCVFKVVDHTNRDVVHAITLHNGETWRFPISECPKLSVWGPLGVNPYPRG
jgi:hypothetical protein